MKKTANYMKNPAKPRDLLRGKMPSHNPFCFRSADSLVVELAPTVSSFSGRYLFSVVKSTGVGHWVAKRLFRPSGVPWAHMLLACILAAPSAHADIYAKKLLLQMLLHCH